MVNPDIGYIFQPRTLRTNKICLAIGCHKKPFSTKKYAYVHDLLLFMSADHPRLCVRTQK